VNTVVSLNLEGDPKGGRVLVSGNDFYSSPRLSPDGTRLAWLTWNHPNMPWDGTELWVAKLRADGSLGRAGRVAGGPRESIFQPEWSPDGILHFVSDRTGWWNLYRWRDGRVEPLTEMEAEFGRPQWVFGMSTYAFESAGRIICAYTRQGTWHLASLDTATRRLEPIETPYTELSFVRAMPGRVVFLGYAGAGQAVAKPHITPYFVAKTGVVLYAKALAARLAPHGVTVNVVAPGVAENSVTQPLREIPMGRAAYLGELVDAVGYFVSTSADYVTGQVLEVAGGWNL